MVELTPEELAAFPDIYDSDRERLMPSSDVVASLIRRGILTQADDVLDLKAPAHPVLVTSLDSILPLISPVLGVVLVIA
jgi:hypothetical protein